MNKIYCKTKQCVLFYTSASQEKTRICCQERLHSHCAPAGLCAPEAQHTWAGPSDPAPAPGHHGTCWSSMGAARGSWTALHKGQTHLSTDLQLLSTTGAVMGPSSLLSTHQGLRCHWGEHLPALCVCFNLNLSVTLAHLVKTEVTSRLLWCTQDPVGCSPPQWEDGSNVHTAATPQSPCFSNLCHATLQFQHTLGSKKRQAFQRGLWTEKLMILNSVFLTLPFEDTIAKWEECQGEQDCPQDTGVCCHLWEQTQQLH